MQFRFALIWILATIAGAGVIFTKGTGTNYEKFLFLYGWSLSGIGYMTGQALYGVCQSKAKDFFEPEEEIYPTKPPQ